MGEGRRGDRGGVRVGDPCRLGRPKMDTDIDATKTVGQPQAGPVTQPAVVPPSP